MLNISINSKFKSKTESRVCVSAVMCQKAALSQDKKGTVLFMLKRVLFILLALSILTACICAVSCTDGDTENSSNFSSRTSSDTSSRGDTSSRNGSEGSGTEATVRGIEAAA